MQLGGVRGDGADPGRFLLATGVLDRDAAVSVLRASCPRGPLLPVPLRDPITPAMSAAVSTPAAPTAYRFEVSRRIC